MVFPEVHDRDFRCLRGNAPAAVFGVTTYAPEKEEKVLFEMLSWRPIRRYHCRARTFRGLACDVAKIQAFPWLKSWISMANPVDYDGWYFASPCAGRKMAEAILKGGL